MLVESFRDTIWHPRNLLFNFIGDPPLRRLFASTRNYHMLIASRIVSIVTQLPLNFKQKVLGCTNEYHIKCSLLPNRAAFRKTSVKLPKTIYQK
jgi:hypothetical protein